METAAPLPDPDLALRRQLAKHRAFATGLLLFMAALAVTGYMLPLNVWSGLLRDSAKAGFIGGVADWFAVTALFRHPLGLPIPHTAILPAQKERLGAALGRFVANHVFTETDVRKFLGNLDSPAILRRFLANPASTQPMAEALAGMLPKLLASIEDGQARRLLARLLPRLIGGRTAGTVVARALHGLVDGGRHQEVFSFILNQLKETLRAREDILRDAIKERVREQGGRLVGWALGASVARRVISGVNLELERISPDSSEMREAFDEWVHREIERLETDPARAAELGAAIKNVLAHDTVKAWAWDVWARLRRALEMDAAKPHGRSVSVIEGALANLGEMLEKDDAAKARVTAAVQSLALNILPGAQAELSGFIGRVIGQWDTATITDKLELRVGKDLQYIRVNGTMVGFFLGALIYGLLLLVK
ncbi:MAG: hypothetical protein B7Z75_00215 [Acidocella sp. 20-57-95]|nr:MAG: hypothetical protein B7Z75_00215 [Acidocella sp. 20-57-95]OYV62284.1 MAG: hypothetical protein B7Z71_01805 [Acidocella sp. 21-58-7]HQT63341.1 DUF445 domain-containing protein [Acidocella sp.]HQU03942.1 DUF445 domain-containing protein [Acidocella sp.]